MNTHRRRANRCGKLMFLGELVLAVRCPHAILRIVVRLADRTRLVKRDLSQQDLRQRSNALFDGQPVRNAVMPAQHGPKQF